MVNSKDKTTRMLLNKKKITTKITAKKPKTEKRLQKINKADDIYIVLKSYLIMELKIQFHLYNFICEY